MGKKNFPVRILEYIGIASAILMTVLVFINVVLRYCFNSGIIVSEELSRFAFIWLISVGIILCELDNEHIRIDMLVNRLKGKTKLAVELTAYLLVALVFVLVTIGSVIDLKYTGGVPAPTTGLPQAVILIWVTIIGAAMVGISIYKAAKLFAGRDSH